MKYKIGVLADCSSPMGNTGIFGCDINLGAPTGIIPIPKGKKYTYLEVQTLATKLIADAAQDSKSKRIYPIQDAKNTEDKTPESVKETYGNGTTRKVRDGFYAADLTFETAMNYYQQIKLLDGKQGLFDFLLIFADNNAIIGREIKEATSASSFGGFSFSEFSVSNYMQGTNTTSAKFKIMYTFKDNKQFDQQGTAVVFGEDYLVSDLKGLQTIELNPAGAAGLTSGGTVTLSAKLGAANLTDTYPTELAVASTWKVTDATGAAITVSTAIVSGGDIGLLLTTGFPATVGAKIYVTLGTPTQIATSLGSTGFDCQTLELTRP